jgi:hypothetical protein
MFSRVSYIWSRQLQDACDQLPSNIGRSSMVHDLHRAFGLFEPGLVNVVEPDAQLGDRIRLERFHDRGYISTSSCRALLT